MKKHVLLFASLFLSLGSELIAQHPNNARWGRYLGPNTLGFYSLEHDTSMKAFLEHFGAKPTGRDIYCFSDPEHGLYLYVRPMDDRSGRVADVLLSSFPNCKGLPTTKATIDPSVWKTPEGIGIGSTKEDLVRAYHEPIFIKKLDMKNDLGVIAGIRAAGASQISVGDLSYLYSCLLSEKEGCPDDNRSARIGLSAGKIIWIHVANSE